MYFGYIGLLGASINFFMLCITYSLKIESYPLLGVMAGLAGFFIIPLTALFATYST
jgi:hypothetical protein